jgi:hypothetical protein
LNQEDKIIQEGLAEIDKEIQDDEEIRLQGANLKDALKLNRSVRLAIIGDDYWQVGSTVLSWIDKTTGEQRQCVRLICANENRMKIGQQMYQPLTIDAEIDENFDYEDALLAACQAFVAKMYGVIKVELLDDGEN